MKMKTIATMLATLTLAGWAQAGETGSIVIYRQAGMIQPFSSFPFNINHGPRMKVSNGRYVRLNLVPGDYTISHDHWGLIPGPEDPQRVHVDAGKTVYFQSRRRIHSFYYSRWLTIKKKPPKRSQQ
jgi:hypothetical protein